jgi:(p)ppGpp synthase/HD superfamily hydrolase
MAISDRYMEGLAYAFSLHRNQVRKGSNVPYVAHLLGVSSLVWENGGDEDAAIAGLLHDAAEDQGGRPTLAAIGERFGPVVAALVEACTNFDDGSEGTWTERKERYLEHLAHAPPQAQLVAACDKLYNARAILADYRAVGESLWARFGGGREGVLWYYARLADAFTIESRVVDELRRTIEQLLSLTRDPDGG